MKANRITEIMHRIEDLPYRKIIFDGKWGIGKTKHIMDYIEDKENIYYISLFGKKDIKSFYEELYYLLLSEQKVFWEKIKKNFEKINFSKFGVNVSIPLISDIFVNIQNKLKDTKNITIVIDDVERKDDNFDIKEIFGFIDTVTKMENIKVVLVASTENFSDQTKTAFNDYSEKSIDRVYQITNYSEDAPQNIVGEKIWLHIKNMYQETGSQNLRTLDKANLFVKEVMNELSEETFNQGITQSDIYKLCFAVVIFIINYEDKVESSSENKELYKVLSPEEKNKNYIWHNILKRNLDNSKMFNFIPLFYDWYKTGEFQNKELNQMIDLVNSYIKMEHPLFLSDEEISKEANDYYTFINNIDENISFNNFIKRLDELAVWCAPQKLEFLKFNIKQLIECLVFGILPAISHSIFL